MKRVKRPVRSVLVILPFGIGDTLFALRMVEALRRERSGIRIGFLGNERTKDLLRMHEDVDRVFVFHRDRLRRLWRKHPWLSVAKLAGLLREVRAERFDAAVDLSLGRQYAFFAALCGIRTRLGHDYRGRGLWLTHRRPLAGFEGKPVAEWHLDLLEAMGIRSESRPGPLRFKFPQELLAETEALLLGRGLRRGEEYFAVAPGGGKTWGADAVYKQWDPGRFAEAADRFSQASGLRPVLAGDRSESELLFRVARAMRVPAVVMCGEPLDRTAALLKGARLFLGNDGGLLHLADALAVPSVSLFGPVDERVYGPTSAAPRAVLTADVPCRPCYRQFHFPPCPHARRCLEEIGADRVVEALQKIV